MNKLLDIFAVIMLAVVIASGIGIVLYWYALAAALATGGTR